MKAIFLDIDGVLIEGMHYDNALRRPWTLDIENDLGINRHRFETEAAAKIFTKDVLTGHRDIKEVLRRELPKLSSNRCDAEDFVAYWLTHDAQINRELLDCMQPLRNATGVQLYIATNQEHNRANYLWNQLGLKRVFDGMFYSAQIGLTKHDAAFFHHINQAIGLKPGESLLFDDTPVCVTMAQQAGWEAAQYRTIHDFLNHPFVKNAFTLKANETNREIVMNCDKKPLIVPVV